MIVYVVLLIAIIIAISVIFVSHQPKPKPFAFETDQIKSFGNPILTKSIIRHDLKDRVVFETTVYEKGFIVYSDISMNFGEKKYPEDWEKKVVRLSPTELNEIIALKKQIIKEDLHCCPDFDATIIGMPYLYFPDIDKKYVTNGSCIVDSMVSFKKLNELLKNIIEPRIWI